MAKPDYKVTTPIERGDKTFWRELGAAWIAKDGKSITVMLDGLPVSGKLNLFVNDDDRSRSRDDGKKF